MFFLIKIMYVNTYSLHQKTQASTEANKIQITPGGTQRSTLKKYRHIDNRLSTLPKQRFLQAELTVQDYTDQSTYLLHMKIRQQAIGTQTPISASKTCRPRLHRPSYIPSSHENFTVV